MIHRIENKCDNCMRCVKECVSSVWRDIHGVPVPDMPQQCNRCGHCIAVCPRSAIQHSGLPDQLVRKVDRTLIQSDGYKELVMSRRSIRHYKDTAVPPDMIRQVIDLARYSPTASNSQNVEYTVITDRELLKKVSVRLFGLGERVFGWMNTGWGRLILHLFKKTDIAQTLNKYKDSMEYYIAKTAEGRDFILHHAPVLVLVHGPKNKMFSNDNCTIASVNIINYAYSLGLGTCYIGYLTMALKFSATLRKWLNIPQRQKVYASIVMGYPRYTHTFVAPRDQSTITFIR